MFIMDGEFGAEVYCGATTEYQALEVFRPASRMLKNTPQLIEECGAEIMVMNLSLPDDGSRFEPLVGDPGDGSSPSCAIVDEYHEHVSSALYDTMITGMGAREHPLMFVITTAGYNLAGPCYVQRGQVKDMLLHALGEGGIENDELFGIIYTIDEGDDWQDPKVLRKANPNLACRSMMNTCCACRRTPSVTRHS
ncbi:terminase large subunit domain-containing protein [Pseudomonas sp. S5D5]|uniref:terminase large subunit domain-containing protein n=1 Tax=Pseudomonas sp. S5D5 TaxID=2083056 RepID=UPI0035325B4B